MEVELSGPIIEEAPQTVVDLTKDEAKNTNENVAANITVDSAEEATEVAELCTEGDSEVPKKKRIIEGFKELYMEAVEFCFRMEGETNLSSGEKELVAAAKKTVEKGRAHFATLPEYLTNNQKYANRIEENIAIKLAAESEEKKATEAMCSKNTRVATSKRITQMKEKVAPTNPASDKRASQSLPKNISPLEKPKSSNEASHTVGAKNKICIMAAEFPKILLSAAQLKVVEQYILDKIFQLQNDCIKPQFSSCEYKGGWLLFICKNDSTADWLKINVSKINICGGIKLKALDQEAIPMMSFLGNFPNCRKITDKRILGLIKGQNYGLNADCWEIRNRFYFNDRTELTIAMDPDSAETLRKRANMIFCGFGMVVLYPKIKGLNVGQQSYIPPQQAKKRKL